MGDIGTTDGEIIIYIAVAGNIINRWQVSATWWNPAGEGMVNGQGMQKVIKNVRMMQNKNISRKYYVSAIELSRPARATEPIPSPLSL